MLTYIQNIRNRLDGIDDTIKEPPVFVSWSGNKMSSSMVSAQKNSFWAKAVGHMDNRLRDNPNLVRKSAVSKVHEKKKGMKKDLANLMCHSELTATRIYFLENKTKMAGETSAALHTLFREEDPEENLDAAIKTHFKEEIENGKISITIAREKKIQSAAFAEVRKLVFEIG